MPFADKPFLKSLTGDKAAGRLAVTPVVALCDFVTAVSIQPPQGKPRELIDELIKPKTADDGEENEPDEVTTESEMRSAE